MRKKSKNRPDSNPICPAAQTPCFNPLPLVLILCAFAVTRILFFHQTLGTDFAHALGMDETYYYNWATAIANGKVVGNTVFYGMPLYAYFVAGLFTLFGKSLMVIRYAQALLGGLNCLLVYGIAARIFSKQTGLLAAGLFVLYGLFAYFEWHIVSVTLFTTLSLSGILLLILYNNKPAAGTILLSGATLGASVITMGANTLFVLFALWLIVKQHGRAGIRHALIFLAGFLSVLSLTAMHNYAAQKDFMIGSAHSGITFYTGNNPNANPNFSAIQEINGTDIESFMDGSRSYAEQTTGQELTPSQVNAFWTKRAFHFIAQHPWRFLHLVWRKAVSLITTREFFDTTVSYYFFRENIPVLRFIALDFAVICSLALIGFLTRNPPASRILSGFIITYAGGLLLFMINSRYRLPMMPVLIVFAAAGCNTLFAALKLRSVTAFLYAGAGIACFAISHAQLSSQHPVSSGSYLYLGLAYNNQGQYDKAITMFTKALETEPHNAELNNNIGQSYLYKGMVDKAEHYIREALTINPGLPQAHSSLGIILKHRGLLEESLKEHKLAADLRPNNPDYHLNLGNAYARMKQFDRAIDEFKTCIRLFEKPGYYDALGFTYFQIGQKAHARQAWERALALDPFYEQARKRLKQYIP